MTASSFSKGGKGGDEGKEEEEHMSRAEFVSDLIKAIRIKEKKRRGGGGG